MTPLMLTLPLPLTALTGDVPMRSLLRVQTDQVDRERNEHPTGEPPASHPTAPSARSDRSSRKPARARNDRPM